MDAQILQDVSPKPGETWTEMHTKQLFEQAALRGSAALITLTSHLLAVEADLRYQISLREAAAAGIDYYALG